MCIHPVAADGQRLSRVRSSEDRAPDARGLLGVLNNEILFDCVNTAGFVRLFYCCRLNEAVSPVRSQERQVMSSNYDGGSWRTVSLCVSNTPARNRCVIFAPAGAEHHDSVTPRRGRHSQGSVRLPVTSCLEWSPNTLDKIMGSCGLDDASRDVSNTEA